MIVGPAPAPMAVTANPPLVNGAGITIGASISGGSSTPGTTLVDVPSTGNEGVLVVVSPGAAPVDDSCKISTNTDTVPGLIKAAKIPNSLLDAGTATGVCADAVTDSATVGPTGL